MIPCGQRKNQLLPLVASGRLRASTVALVPHPLHRLRRRRDVPQPVRSGPLADLLSFRKLIYGEQDVLTWSPNGRLHQVEYAIEAVTQGSTVVGCKGRDSVVIAALKRTSSELAARHEKIFVISASAGIAVSGLVADGQQIASFLRRAAINSHFVHTKEARISHLSSITAKKLQACTQHGSRRPYGVGVLMAGSDETGVHLFQLLPTGEVYECEGVGIGSRSQAARTYLEKHRMSELPLDQLVMHSLSALREACPDGRIDAACCSVGVVHEGEFKLLVEAQIALHLDALESAR